MFYLHSRRRRGRDRDSGCHSRGATLAFSIPRTAPSPRRRPRSFRTSTIFTIGKPWSPWAKIDPNSKSTFEGPSAGKGAIFRWEGNRNVGAGSMLIIESRPNDLILIDLTFLKPFRGKNVTEFHVQARWWSDDRHLDHDRQKRLHPPSCFASVSHEHGQNGGSEFEKGLANMKAVVESSAGEN